MNALLLALALASGAGASAGAPKAVRDAVLQRQIEQAIAGFHGRVGVYVRQLATGREAAVNADELFPTASMIKVPILLTLYDDVAAGRLDYDAELVYSSSRAYNDGSLISSFRDGQKIALPTLTWLTAAYSDNAAALWCQELAGGGLSVNRWLAAHGFSRTRVDSRTPGREREHKLYGWGQTTPREMAELFVGLRRRRLLPPAASDELYRVLSGAYWNSEALSQIPPWVQAASKQGAIEHSRSEALLVSAPAGDYVLSIFTKDQPDSETDYKFGNEGFQILRAVSGLVWRHFEPRSKWAPAKGWQGFFKE
ncbi:MAG: serine hydrolase [Elusimicrobia bacterium]|nr:serine hydrolase [Elusimicrobiota bacterium]MDE2236650.1 serine hydrolase [Elusimicrobiota bacterium]MDE2424688.1 serine hydrolase [Elusimicrobiota bacterium]